MNAKLREIYDLFERDLAVAQPGELKSAVDYLREQVRLLTNSPQGDITLAEGHKMRIARLAKELDRRDYRRTAIAGFPFPTPEQVSIAGYECFFDVPAGLKEQITELQRVYDRDSAAVMAHTDRAAKIAFREQETKLKGAVESGDVSSHTHRSSEEIAEEFRLKRRALQLALQSHTAKAKELIAPVLESFRAELSDRAACLETNQRDAAECYRLKFEPSNVLKLHWKILTMIEDGVFLSHNRPADIGAFLISAADYVPASPNTAEEPTEPESEATDL